ncbi:hypothetical protein GZH46_02224, partial [Fragariocoptes setiger]
QAIDTWFIVISRTVKDLNSETLNDDGNGNGDGKSVLVAVLAMSVPATAISPYFTSTYYGLENTIERFTYCRAYPITGPNMNASDYLIESMKSFITVANFSSDSLEDLKQFMSTISLRTGYEVESGLSELVKYNMTKSDHCQLVEIVMDAAYPLLRQSAYNRSSTLNLTGLELPSPANSAIKIRLSEFVNALWINAGFTREEMDSIGHAVTEHIKELQSNYNDSTKRAGGQLPLVADTAACCSYTDWLSYYIDSGLAFLTRVRLGLSTRVIESRMAISSGFSFTKNKLTSGFSRLIPSRGAANTTLAGVTTTTAATTVAPSGLVNSVQEVPQFSSMPQLSTDQLNYHTVPRVTQQQQQHYEQYELVVTTRSSEQSPRTTIRQQFDEQFESISTTNIAAATRIVNQFSTMAKCCVDTHITMHRHFHRQDDAKMTTETATTSTQDLSSLSVVDVFCRPRHLCCTSVARCRTQSKARTRVITLPTTILRQKEQQATATVKIIANKMNVIITPELAKRLPQQQIECRNRNHFIRPNSVISILFALITSYCVSASTVTNIDNNNIPFFTYTPASASASYQPADQLLKQQQQQLLQHQHQQSFLQQRRHVVMRPSADQMVRNIDTMSALIEPVVESDLVEAPFGGAGSGTFQVPFTGDQASQLAAAQCQMPITWAGKWYQRGTKDPIKVSNSGISDKGVCRERKGDKFLFEHPQTRCLVCMVIIERHLNVLQYKESPADCQQDINNSNNQQSPQSTQLQSQSSTLERLCSEIAGDAQLDTLFRIDTPPIECPIVGHYTFTYDNCKDPVSSLESCTDKRQLNFRFNACPDVPGSEIKTEVLKCYADWTEGSNFYMIGRLESASNGADRGKFRCYMYEKSGNNDYLMAQSQDESCDGLFSASDGPRSMRITARVPHEQRCLFPSYLSEQQNWLHVDNSLIYMFGPNSSTFHVKETKEGNIIEESTCVRSMSLPPARSTLSSAPRSFDQFIVQTTKNCLGFAIE